MLKRLVATGAVVGLAALTVGSVGPATGHGDSHDDDTIRVLSTSTEDTYVDNGDAGESQGDTFVFTSKLTQRGKTVGHTGVVCTITSEVRLENLCIGTARFDDGQLAVQGLFGEDDADEFELAITGGTGDWEGASGTLVVEPLSDTKEKLTFHLDD